MENWLGGNLIVIVFDKPSFITAAPIVLFFYIFIVAPGTFFGDAVADANLSSHISTVWFLNCKTYAGD
jgi:hypothetical protein